MALVVGGAGVAADTVSCGVAGSPAAPVVFDGVVVVMKNITNGSVGIHRCFCRTALHTVHCGYMLQKLLHLVQYHNATTWLLIVGLFFGIGTAFAATDPELRQAAADTLVSENHTLTKTDNSALLALDMDTFDPELRIHEVVEDDEYYYASYAFTSLALLDGVWQEIEKSDTLTVNKQALAGRDLGLYLADELGELTRQERTYLEEVQALERKKGATRKTVAIDYGGLIGRFLDPEEVEFDGYEPVVEESEPQEALQLASEQTAQTAPETQRSPAPERQQTQQPERTDGSADATDPDATETPAEPAPEPAEPTAPEQAEQGDASNDVDAEGDATETNQPADETADQNTQAAGESEQAQQPDADAATGESHTDANGDQQQQDQSAQEENTEQSTDPATNSQQQSEQAEPAAEQQQPAASDSNDTAAQTSTAESGSNAATADTAQTSAPEETATE